MKQKTILFSVAIMLLAQTVFAERWNQNEVQFLKYFEQSDLQSMESVLRQNRNQMDLTALLYSVIMNYSLSNHRNLAPINTDRRLAVDIIQMFARVGADFNIQPTYYYCKNRQNMTLGIEDAADISYLGAPYILQEAISNSFDINIIRALLEGGADMYIFNGNFTSNLFPINDRNIALAKLFIEKGYNVNSPYLDGDTISILQQAVEEGQIGIVRLLVESGAKVNHQTASGKTAAQIAYEKKETDIYNYLKQNGAVWSPPSQVATAPPPSSRPRQTYDDSYDYSPPPSSSSRSPGSPSSGSSGSDLGKVIIESLQSPLESGTYGLAGSNAKVTFTAIGKSGIIMYVTRDNRRGTGSYSINGNTMTVQIEGLTDVYTITSKTSFTGRDGSIWVRTGY